MAKELENLKEENYKAGMVLSGVGDALGYKNGHWEFCSDGNLIHDDLYRLGGLNTLEIHLPEWRVSDDTVMHLATAEALVENQQCTEKLKLYRDIALKYKMSMDDMEERAPGITCKQMCEKLQPSAELPEGLRIPFNPRGGGCGAAMRSMCIGLRYPQECQLDDLIAVSIESGRLTHHHPTGYLGSLASALFTSYAVQDKPLIEWGVGLLSTLEKAKKYISYSGSVEPLHTDKRTIGKNINHWDYFKLKWEFYLALRNITDGQSMPRYAPDEGQVGKRDQFYRMISFEDNGGASGHDAPMIAYDALLACKGKWLELCNRAMFHGGDSDSTGVIAGCLYGILYGLNDVSPCNFEHLEYVDRLRNTGKEIFILATEAKFKPANLENGFETISESRKNVESNKIAAVNKHGANNENATSNNQTKEETDNSPQLKSDKSVEPPNENKKTEDLDVDLKKDDDFDTEAALCESAEPDDLTKESKNIADDLDSITHEANSGGQTDPACDLDRSSQMGESCYNDDASMETNG